MSLLEEYYDRFENPPTDLAKKILFALINDLSGRKGFDHEWDHLDETIQLEILEENLEKINKFLPASMPMFEYTGKYTHPSSGPEDQTFSTAGMFTFQASSDEEAIRLLPEKVREKHSKATPSSLCLNDRCVWSKNSL